MKVLIVTQYFWPEIFRINEVATSLRERGHEVTVLTGKPNYPAGKIFDGYTLFGRSREQCQGVEILRMPMLPRGNSSIRLALNYLSFVALGSLIGPFWARGRYDAILVFAVSPITQAIPALVLKMLGKGPVHIWLLDVWPESLSASGAVKSKWVLRVMRTLTKMIHRASDLTLVASAGFADKLRVLGIPPEQIRYVPNFAEDAYSHPTTLARDPQRDAGIPPGFRVMFAGNVGESQDFPTILAAAELLKEHKDIQWVIVGDGRVLPWVREEVARRDLQETFHTVGRYPMEEMPGWYECADAMLVTLRSEPIFALTVPGKIHSYMAASKAIVAALDGDPARVVEESGCGICAPAGDAPKLADAVLEASRKTREELESMGRKGREYFNEHFERQRVISKLEECLQSVNV